MDKMMMNKLDDMEMELDDKELDMVVGGRKKGGGNPTDEHPLQKLGRSMNDAIVNGGKAVVNGARNAFDNLLSKVFGPPRKR